MLIAFQPPENQTNTWHEDRTRADQRFRREGGGDLPNYYYDNQFDGKDKPFMSDGDLYSFRLVVVDLCRGKKPIYTSRTIRVQMPGGE